MREGDEGGQLVERQAGHRERLVAGEAAALDEEGVFGGCERHRAGMVTADETGRPGLLWIG